MLSSSFSSERIAWISLLVTILSFAVLLAWIIVIQNKSKKNQDLLKELFAGKKHPNLEELLLNQDRSIRALDRDIQELYNISNQINDLALRGMHKFASIRFNPFKDVGGDQSFTIALLNGKNNGVVLTSLYTREGTRVYSKSISGGKSEKYPLTEEEEEVLRQAIMKESKTVQ